MSSTGPSGDPVPRTVVLPLDDAFRVLEAIEDARLATVIRMLHGRLGLDEGGAL